MNKLFVTTIMVLLALTTPAYATEYLTIIGRDAPSSDVVTAANFAGTMTGLGLTFSAAIDTDFIAQEPNLNNYYLVIIDDAQIRLIGSTQYEKQIIDYFEEQDFNVQRIHNPTIADVRITPEDIIEEEPTTNVTINTTTQANTTQEDNLTLPEPEEQCVGCERDGECYSQGTILDEEYCDGLAFQAQKSDEATCNQDYECITRECTNGTCGEERRNIVVRVLSWFANFF